MHYIPYPSWLSPNIFPDSFVAKLPSWLSWLSLLKWYGMMYVIATVIIYSLVAYQIRSQKAGISTRNVEDFFMWGLLGMLLGARLMATLVWDDTWLYVTHPWMIILPLNEVWQFVGFQGMSFHGGLVGLITACWLYTHKNGYTFFQWMDWVSAAFPLGYTFGRLGNFINAELYGRPVEGGMLFPHAQPYPLSNPDVLAFAKKIGATVKGKEGYINLPRHPSQLYEALGEGILLFLFLWFFVRPRKKFTGQISATFLISYGLIRFFIEYFRDTSDELGFVIQLQKIDLFAIAPLNLSLGQIFCVLMIIAGGIIWIVQKNKLRRF